jgi:hypothetical protein
MYDCTNMGFLVVALIFPGGAGGVVYVFHAAAALLWAWAGAVFGHAFKRLVLAPRGDLVSWIKLLRSVGLWAAKTAPILPSGLWSPPSC